MGARTRLVVACGLLVVLGVVLTACMGGWFTPKTLVTVIIGDPVARGAKWEVLLSVASMPDGGLAAMRVNVDGMTYDNAKISNVIATGLNGFTVLASEFNDLTGKGRFVIANPATGVVGGTILKLTFDANAVIVTGDVTLDRTKTTLGSHLNTPIVTWNIRTTVYYAK